MPSPKVPLLAIFCASLVPDALRADESLRYTFRTEVTNAYEVRIETTVEVGTVTHEGVVVLIPRRPGSEGSATLGLQGSLASRNARPPMHNPMMMPGAVVPPVISLPPHAEIEVSPRGGILSGVANPLIPLQAGDLGSLLFLPLPTEAGQGFEVTREVQIPDPSPRAGVPWRPPYYDGSGYNRGSQASLSATRSLVVRATAVTAATAALEWKSELRSLRLFEGKAAVEGTWEGTATLDRQKGLLQSVRFSYRESSAGETVTRRSRLTFEARLLAAAELEAAVARTRPRTPGTLTVAQVRTALEDLASANPEKRNHGVEALQTGDWEPLPPEVLALAEKALETADDSVRWAAGRVVSVAATPAQVPTLLRLLRQTESGARQPAIEALGRLKDPRAIEPLVEMIARGDNERYGAIQALTGFGPEAEEPVLGLFQEKNLETRRAACQILGTAGTARSLETLRAAMLDPDRQLRDVASQAVGEIMARAN
jgi:hypothetical protein